MPPAFFVSNTARHRRPRSSPLPLPHPSLFPARFIQLASTRFASAASAIPSTPFHGSIDAD